MAVGVSGSTATSSDGVIWSESLSGLTGIHFTSVASNGTTLVAVGTGGVATSTDGVVWTQQVTPAEVTTADPSLLILNDVTWDGTQFIAVGSHNPVQYNLGNYVSTIITSPDGVTWTSRTPQMNYTVASGWRHDLYSVASSGTQIVAVGIFNHPTNGQYGYVEWSTDGGVTWSGSTISQAVGSGLLGIAWGGVGGSKYVAVGRAGTILTSPDGINTWTAQSAGLTTDDLLYDVEIQRDGSFVIAGDFNDSVSPIVQSPVLTSSDGVTWTAETSNTTQKIVNLASQLSVVVAVGPSASTLVRQEDVFPSDPAATVDYDLDGLPDAWNPNATSAQIAASSLMLDPRPGNFQMQYALLGAYPLDGYANDISGNGLDGTNTNGVAVADRKGNVASALGFSAVNSAFARIDNIPASQDFTVAVWARSKSAAWNQLGVIASSRGANGFILHPDGNTTWSGYIFDQAGAFQHVANNAMADITTVWHHYALTYDSYSNTARIYNDGVEVGVNPAMSVVRSSTGTISVELAKDMTLARYGDVELDDFRVYKRALSASEIYAFGVPDYEAPVMTLNGADPITVAHGSAFNDPGVTVTDNLDTGLVATATPVDVYTVGTYTVTYTVSDSEGNAATPITRTVHVTDQTPPVVTLNGANSDTWYKPYDYIDPGYTVQDNVNGTQHNLNKTGTVDVTVPGSYTITYAITDLASNETVVTRTVIIPDSDGDGVADAFDAFPNDVAASVDYDADGLPDVWNAGKTVADSTTGLVLDRRPGNLAMQNNLLAHFPLDGNLNDANGDVSNSVNTLGAAIADRNGNADSALSFARADGASAYINSIPNSQDFTVAVWVRSMAPVWNQIGGSGPIIYSTGDNAFGIHASGVNTTTLVSYVEDETLAWSTPTDIYSAWHHYAITYASATNTARMYIDGVQVGQDKTLITPRGATAGTLGVNLGMGTGETVGGVELDDLRFYGKELTQSEILAFGATDNEAPVITVDGANPMTVAHGVSFNDPGVTVTDNLDPGLVATATGEVDIYSVGTYTITYSVSDNSGNAATPVTRTVHVTDQTAPVITLNGASAISMVQGDDFIDPGATVTENVDTGLYTIATYEVDIGFGNTPTASLDVNTPGVYTITYSVSDAAGNAAVPVTRTVTVVGDTQAPVITILGNNPLTVPQGVTFTDPGTTVTDNSVTILVPTVTGTVDTNTVGTYTLTYNVSDRAGNAAAPVSRTVHVTDQTAPVIELNGLATMSVPQGIPFTDPGSVVTDNVDTGLVATVTGFVDVYTLGSYTLTYNVSDAAGNAAATVTRTVHVALDETAPVITLNTDGGQITVTVPLGGTFTDPGSVVTDNIETGLVATVTGEVDVNTPGLYILYYDAVDAAGNQAVQVRRHVLVDRGANPKGVSWYLSGYYDVNHPDIVKLAKNPSTGVIIGVGAGATNGADGLYSTSNGSTWTISAFAAYNSTFSDVIWAGNQFVAVGSGPANEMVVAKSSNDGTSWSYFNDATKSSRLAAGYISQGTYAGSIQAVGPFTNGSDVYYSADGATWLAGTSLAGGNSVNVDYRGMIASNPWPVAYGSVSGDPTDSVWVGNGDGIFFDQQYVLTSTARINDMIIKDGTTTALAVGTNGLVMTANSYGAGAWTEMTLPDPTISLNAVTWTGSEFVAVSDNQLFASIDGVTWQKTMDFHGMNATDIIFNNNQLVIVGYANLVVSGLTNDSDGDGVRDILDAFPGDATASSDLDFDGVPDGFDAFPTDPAVSVDYDMDGQPDAWNTNATAAQIAASSYSLDPTPGTVAMQNSLVAHYKLDGNINDSSGNNIHGMNTNGVAIADRDGNPASAMSFSSVDSAFARIDGLPATMDFTIAVWARSKNPLWNQNGVIASSRGTNGFVMHTNAGAKSWTGVVYGDAGYGPDSAPAYTQADITGAWHHYALSYSSVGKATRMYVDGVQVSIRPLTNVLRSATGTISVELGKDFGFPDRFGDVELDDLRIYDRELTWDELFSFGEGDLQAPVITLNGANPVVVERATVFNDPGATVSDNVDSGLVATASPMDVYTLGAQTVTYTASDLAGNAASPVTRTVQVVAHVVSTIAGNGSQGSADGVGTQAQVAFPDGVAVDSYGNLYVVEPNRSDVMRKIDPAGNVSTVSIWAPGYSFRPQDVAIDAQGNLYFADYWGNRIFRRTVDGTTSLLAGTGVAGFIDGYSTTQAQFNRPHSIAVDPTGSSVYVASSTNYAIRKVDVANGMVSTVAGTGVSGFNDGPGATAQFGWMGGIALDAAGNLYVADSGNYRIRKVDTAGNVSTFAGDGSASTNDGPAATAGFAYNLGRIAVDSQGNVLVAHSAINSIRVIDTAGYVSTWAGNGNSGGNDGPGSIATFDNPKGIAVDASGNIYVSEYIGHRIRKITMVTSDSTPPVINVGGGITSVDVPQFGVFTPPTVTAPDNVDGFASVNSSGTVDTQTLGNYTVTYNATDSSGNAAEPVSITVNVVPDTTAPAISLKGSNPIVVPQGGTFNDPGVTVNDNSGVAITPNVTGIVDTNVIGEYTVTYTATDPSNNSASVTRTVSVRSFASEVFPPAGSLPAGWTQSAGTDFGWVMTTDNVYDGYASLRSDPAMFGVDSYSAAVEVTMDTYSGNVVFAYDVDSEQYSDEFNFYVDGVQQDLSGGFGPPFASGLNQPWTLFNVAVAAGTHTFKWEYVKDGSTTQGQDAAWIDSVMLPPAVGTLDTAAPLIDLYGNAAMTIAQNSTFIDPGVSNVFDNVDNGLSASVSGAVNTAVPGEYTLTYTATDAAGNVGTATRTVTVMSLASEVFPPAGNMPAGWVQSAGSNYGWVVDSTAASVGVASLRSDPAMYGMDNNMAAIEVTASTQSGNISFDYLVDSEAGYDFIRFYIDGVMQLEDSDIGNPWKSVSYPVSAGTHTFKWEYSKDGSALDGADAAWIDNVVMPPLNEPPVIGADSLSVWKDQSVTFTAASLLANDSDADGDTISLVSLGQPSHGALVDNGDGSYTYTPSAGYSGPDAISQVISDGSIVDVYQWAGSATASTEYDVAPNGWSASQVTGPPNVTAYGDDGNAWAPLAAGTAEWLQLGYDTYTKATGITVYETFTNGYINQVELIDTNDVTHVVWTGTDTTPDGVIGQFVLNFPETAYQVKAVKISFAAGSPNWIEIDAVELRGRAFAGNEVQGTVDITVQVDTDGDGVADSMDLYPNNPNFALEPDSDGDGMADSWELANFGDLTTAGIGTDFNNNGVSDVAEFNAGTDPKASTTRARSDFNASGMSDVLLRNGANSQWKLYQMNGSTVTAQNFVSLPNASWIYQGSGDFNGDGVADVLVRSNTGSQWRIYRLNGSAIVSNQLAALTADPAYVVKGVGDFNNDGMSDVLLRNTSTNQWLMYLMNGNQILQQLIPGLPTNAAWVSEGLGDFNGDGMSDVLMRNTTGNFYRLYEMSSSTVLNNAVVSLPPAPWTVQSIGDYNGDGKADIFFRHGTGNYWRLYEMNGGAVLNNAITLLPSIATWTTQASGDFNGDGVEDVLMRDSATGLWRIYSMNGPTVLSNNIVLLPTVVDWTVKAEK